MIVCLFRTWIQVSWGRRTFWFWRPLICQDWLQRMTKVSRFGAKVKFTIFLLSRVSHFPATSCPTRRLFLLHKRTYPSCFDKVGQCHPNNCMFWFLHRFIFPKFIFFLFLLAFCRRDRVTCPGSTFPQCRIGFL